MIMTGNKTDLHYKVVDLIRRYYPDTILVAGLGENQDTEDKRLDSYKEGYMKGQPDLMILDKHKDFKGLCIEFKSPTGNYYVSEAQKEMKKKYLDNGYAFILSNDNNINNNNNIYYLVLRKLTYIKLSNTHYKLLKLTKKYINYRIKHEYICK